jgi:hypothetical protein
MFKILIKILIIFALIGCSALQQSAPKGEYRYVPITDRLKSLSETILLQDLEVPL